MQSSFLVKYHLNKYYFSRKPKFLNHKNNLNGRYSEIHHKSTNSIVMLHNVYRICPRYTFFSFRMVWGTSICDILPLNNNKKVKNDVMDLTFNESVPYSVERWVRALAANLFTMSSNTTRAFTRFTFPAIFKPIFVQI